MDNRIQSYQLHQLPKPSVRPKAPDKQTKAFKDILNQHLVNNSSLLKISKHAEKRLQERGIIINPDRWSMISEKVSEAKTKGVQESLVIVKEAALLVSAKNNIVITALDRNEAKSQIFTNINGTIVID